MVHIGKRIEQVFTEKGMTKGNFADRVGVHRNTVKTLFEQAHIDSQLLYQVSKVLDFDFFTILSEDFRTKTGKGSSMVSEPAAAYAAKKTPMRIVIELDSENEDQKALAMDLMGKLSPKKPASRKR